MSIKLMNEVYGKELTHAEQAILLAMADHADDDGNNCFPSVDRIAYKTGYKWRNVVRVMRQLQERGALVVTCQGGGKKANEYSIRLTALSNKPPFPEWRKENGRYRGDSAGANIAPVSARVT